MMGGGGAGGLGGDGDLEGEAAHREAHEGGRDPSARGRQWRWWAAAARRSRRSEEEKRWWVRWRRDELGMALLGNRDDRVWGGLRTNGSCLFWMGSNRFKTSLSLVYIVTQTS